MEILVASQYLALLIILCAYPGICFTEYLLLYVLGTELWVSIKYINFFS